ncbi:cupin domain-containing protein [Streptomyces sp. 35G-GA-8]|uniref:cupin domain-containing protein n=1 Tax=Streptomyces sp. 35G-GA-8 TaxID=2939434 RepID=UPI00201F5AC0|nr:cupin domain-containing protein [Streptomyces sp. 35G-GA-8]MCL7375301.1 cupin domain-containing protein [Streptomyces sp. 35G-GA-8]
MSESETRVHTTHAQLATEVFDWGSIKWGVSAGLFPGAPLTAGEVIINPGKGHDLHTHPNSDEVLYVVDGEGVQTVGDSGEFPVKTGDFVFVPRGTVHSTFNTGWRQLRVIAIYTPGGAEQALREATDYARLAPGVPPVWERAR